MKKGIFFFIFTFLLLNLSSCSGDDKVTDSAETSTQNSSEISRVDSNSTSETIVDSEETESMQDSGNTIGLGTTIDDTGWVMNYNEVMRGEDSAYIIDMRFGDVIVSNTDSLPSRLVRVTGEVTGYNEETGLYYGDFEFNEVLSFADQTLKDDSTVIIPRNIAIIDVAVKRIVVSSQRERWCFHYNEDISGSTYNTSFKRGDAFLFTEFGIDDSLKEDGLMLTIAVDVPVIISHPYLDKSYFVNVGYLD